MTSMSHPKITAVRIRILFNKPSTEKESRIKMVEMTKPEFLITLWN